MIIDTFSGYKEGVDITKMSPQDLAYPSKNVFVLKGTVYKREGIENDGTTMTVNEAVHSEFVWKDALGGERPIRVHGNTLQVKYNGIWFTLYTNLSEDTIRVYFATWLDRNGSIVKKRLFFTDGSTTLYQWNGAIVNIDSFASDVITIDGTKTLEQEGFDAGNVTTQSVIIYSLDGDTIDEQEENTYSDNPLSGNDITLDTTPTLIPVAGDVVMTKPVAFSDVVSADFALDFIYAYQNHIIIGNYASVSLYWSHIETYSLASGLDFSMPANKRTAASAIYMQLDGNITALISRKNTLWISDADNWYKVVKTVEENAYGMWVSVEKVEVGEGKGALPMAVAKHKDDIIYIAQDKTLQRVLTNEVLGTDEFKLLSDDVEDLFARLNFDDVRLYYLDRAVYIVFPQDSTLIMLDTVEGYFQPPQILPIHCISVIGGVKYGHHNTENQSYKLFSGKDDLGTDIESVIAFGLNHGAGDINHQFRYKQHTTFGVSCRISPTAKVEVVEQFEEEGGKETYSFIIDGANIKTFGVSDDASWATNPYGERAWAGEDMVVPDLKRAVVFDKYSGVSYFDMRPIFTITGTKSDFRLLAYWIDQSYAPRKIGDDLFIKK